MFVTEHLEDYELQTRTHTRVHMRQVHVYGRRGSTTVYYPLRNNGQWNHPQYNGKKHKEEEKKVTNSFLSI